MAILKGSDEGWPSPRPDRAAARPLALAGAAWHQIRDLLWPPQCLGCRAQVAVQGELCGSCWSGLDFITAPFCPCCGLPYPFAAAQDLACAVCLAQPPPFRRARSAFHYGGTARRLVLAFKHGDRTDMAAALARRMAPAGAALLADADLVVPVPLHRGRLWRRRYNQSALLALALAASASRPAAVDVLVRRRATPSQGGRNRSGRRRNVASAFAVPAPLQDRVAGQTILLVDDVFTTGATVAEAARTLVRAGAAAVDVLTVARVVPGHIGAEHGTPVQVVPERGHPIS